MSHGVMACTCGTPNPGFACVAAVHRDTTVADLRAQLAAVTKERDGRQADVDASVVKALKALARANEVEAENARLREAIRTRVKFVPRPGPIRFSQAELSAVLSATAHRLAGEWDESFKGEERALDSAHAKLCRAFARTEPEKP